jgi:hypothetical protein
VVGDLGIEPSVRLREGVTVPCHTLRPVAHLPSIEHLNEGLISLVKKYRQLENPLKFELILAQKAKQSKKGVICDEKAKVGC